MEDALFPIRDRFHSEKQKPFAVDSSANGFRDATGVSDCENGNCFLRIYFANWKCQLQSVAILNLSGIIRTTEMNMESF